MALTGAPASPSICLAWVCDNSSDRAIFCVCANVSTCPFPRGFRRSSVDLHLSIIWSRICSVFVPPNSQLAAWLLRLTTNWSTVSCSSYFIWRKICRSYGTFTCGVSMHRVFEVQPCISRLLPLQMHPDPLRSQIFLGLPFLHNVKVTPFFERLLWSHDHQHKIEMPFAIAAILAGPTLVLPPRQSNGFSPRSSSFVAITFLQTDVSSYHFILFANCSVSRSMKHPDLTKLSARNTDSTRHLTMCFNPP